MREDDGAPRPKPAPTHEIGADLAAVSADEPRDRIALLESEIARLREEERRKVASREAAGAFFRR